MTRIALLPSFYVIFLFNSVHVVSDFYISVCGSADRAVAELISQKLFSASTTAIATTAKEEVSL